MLKEAAAGEAAAAEAAAGEAAARAADASSPPRPSMESPLSVIPQGLPQKPAVPAGKRPVAPLRIDSDGELVPSEAERAEMRAAAGRRERGGALRLVPMV